MHTKILELDTKIEKVRQKKKTMKLRRIVAISALSLLFCTTIQAGPETGQDKPIPEAIAASQEAPKENAYTYSLNEEERELVERVVAAEARGESFQGQMAVAQVIRDRCLTRGQAPIEVCTSPGQFAQGYEGEISSTTEAAVGFVFGGHSIFTYPVTNFYAHEHIEAPEWTYSKEFAGEIGGHRFYR